MGISGLLSQPRPVIDGRSAANDEDEDDDVDTYNGDADTESGGEYGIETKLRDVEFVTYSIQTRKIHSRLRRCWCCI